MIGSTFKDINNISYDILKQSKSFDVFPTPVSNIVRYSELLTDTNTGIHSIPNNYISKNIDLLKGTLRKVFGALDRRKKIIYIDPTLSVPKKNFVELHEVGHEVLPWQRKTFEFIDDHETISHETKIEFEQEANLFASCTLFQLNRFEELSRTLPLTIKTPMLLAKKFGSSNHAAIRKYAESINKRCALIVLNKEKGTPNQLVLRDYFQSKKFTSEFGTLSLPGSFDASWPFVEDYIIGKRFHEEGDIKIITQDSEIDFEYQYFYNTYNVFILLIPKGEKINSRTKIFMNGFD